MPCLSRFGDPNTLTYLEVAERIAKAHILLRSLEIKPGERIALCGKDSPNWVVCFLSVVTYGCVVVPILSDFTPTDVVNIVNHSESEMLIVSDSIWEKLDTAKVKVKAVFSLEKGTLIDSYRKDFVESGMSHVKAEFDAAYPQGFKSADICYPDIDNEEVRVINYTSGTTGFSKGVMLTGSNLVGNVAYALNSKLQFPGSRVLAFLPMAHAFGCAFDMLSAVAAGSHITILGRTPTPSVLLKALAEVKPHLILSVPLVFEKIYKNKIEPLLSTRKMQRLLRVPGLNRYIYSKIRRQLVETLGGCFEQVVIGGAALNSDTENFLRKIHFPFTIGFGMTECGPLISYTYWRDFKSTSAGATISPIMESKVLSSDPEHISGEILVKGQNVMKGYFKNPEATAAVLDEDGWLHTGDVGTRDADGTLYLRGRCKTMILTGSGQNIYPEELEARLNQLPFVVECLVVERKGKLVALVYPDFEAIDKRGIAAARIPELMEKLRAKLNEQVAPYERIASIDVMTEEFQKTPKRSIKRFLYS